MTAKIELRCRYEGVCSCGKVVPIGTPPTCTHWVECDWGRINNPEVDLRRPIEHLMITHASWIETLLTVGPQPHREYAPGSRVSASASDGRLFAHLDHAGRRWTWELFPARWWDDLPSDIMIGRWPD